MLYQSIDSVLLAVPDLEAACRPYEALGLRLSPTRDGRRTLHVGVPGNLFSFHFLADAGRDQHFNGPLRAALAAGRSLFAVVLRVAELKGALDALARKGVRATTVPATLDADALAWVPLHEQAGADLVLVERAQTDAVRHAAAEPDGLLAHSFPLKRLDHLAAVAHDLEAKTHFWTDVLGVPLAGEVRTATLVIRQFRIGDAILELLGAAVPDSPIAQRAPGLVGMASWEVQKLDAIVERARATGFEVSDAAVGALPGTRIATIQGTELAGVNMQLLEYV